MAVVERSGSGGGHVVVRATHEGAGTRPLWPRPLTLPVSVSAGSQGGARPS